MNKVILMGRLTREPEMRYSNGNDSLAIVRFSLAVDRRFKRDGDASADFINCVAFGKNAEFIGKYFKKGQMVSVVGRLQVSSYDDKDGNRRWSTDVVVEENYFAESRRSFEERQSQGGNDNFSNQYSNQPKEPLANEGFVTIDNDVDDDDLPF